MERLQGRVRDVLAGYDAWLGLATVLFVGWYAAFLFPRRAIAALSSLVTLAQAWLPPVPAVGDATARVVVGAVIDLGLPLSVVALFVGFGLFHRQVDTR